MSFTISDNNSNSEIGVGVGVNVNKNGMELPSGFLFLSPYSRSSFTLIISNVTGEYWNSSQYYNNRDFQFWLTNVVLSVGAIFQFFIAFSIFRIFISKTYSDLKTAYFCILAFGYFEAFIVAIIWQFERNANYDVNSWIKYPIFFVRWYWTYFGGYWNAILSLNRCTAIGFPIIHRKLWARTPLMFFLISLFIFPFIVDFPAFKDMDCFFNMFRYLCIQTDIDESIRSTIINAITSMASLFFIAIGLIKYKLGRSKFITPAIVQRNRMERRLVAQTTLVAVFYILTFVCIMLGTLNDLPFFHDLANWLLLIYQYPPIIVLFYVSQRFRDNFLNCYGLSNQKKFSTTITVASTAMKTFPTLERKHYINSV